MRPFGLLTFNANDPSLNTATARAAENWVGRPGAFWADLLLQGFGATAYLVPLLLLNWAAACLFRLARGLVVLRLLIALPALLMLAAPAPRSLLAARVNRLPGLAPLGEL